MLAPELVEKGLLKKRAKRRALQGSAVRAQRCKRRPTWSNVGLLAGDALFGEIHSDVGLCCTTD